MHLTHSSYKVIFIYDISHKTKVGFLIRKKKSVLAIVRKNLPLLPKRDCLVF